MPRIEYLGDLLVVLGLLLVSAGTIGAVRTMWMTFRTLPSGAEATDAVTVDWAKIIAAIAKLPAWAIVVLVGNVQILLGCWLLGATLFGSKLWQ